MGKKKKKGGGGGGSGGGDGVGSIGYSAIKKPPPSSGLLNPHHPVSLRQQTGQQSRGAPGGGAGAVQAVSPSALRAQHLLRVATWAGANVPPLGALLGARLGCLSEAAGVPVPETPHSVCERCESIMQVGVNCSVRVTKNKRKTKPRKTENVCNYVTYICHFCRHGNAKPGTSKSHLKTKISQVAARANLELLGKSAATQISPVNKRTSEPVKKSSEQEGSKHAQISEENGEVAKAVDMAIDEVAPVGESVELALNKAEMSLDKVEEGGAKTVEMTRDEAANPVQTALSKVAQEGADVVEWTLEEVEVQEGAKAVEMVDDEVAKPVELAQMILAQEGAQVSDVAPEQAQVQEGAKSVEMTLDEVAKSVEVTLEEVQVQEGATGMEMTLDKGPSDQGFADEEVPVAAEMSLDKVPVESTKQEDPGAAEMAPPSGLTEKSQQGVAHQERPEAVETRPSEPTKQEDPETTLSKEPPERGQQQGQEGSKTGSEKKGSVQAGPKPVEITRKALDTGTKKKKKRKKHNQPEQEAPRPKEPAGESSESCKKRKRKGWSALKELAGVPQ